MQVQKFWPLTQKSHLYVNVLPFSLHSRLFYRVVSAWDFYYLTVIEYILDNWWWQISKQWATVPFATGPNGLHVCSESCPVPETLGWAAEQKPETIRQPRDGGTKRLRQRLRRHFKQHWRSRPGRSSSVNATLTGRCSKIAAYPVGSQCTVQCCSIAATVFLWHGWSWIEIVASLHFFFTFFWLETRWVIWYQKYL